MKPKLPDKCPDCGATRGLTMIRTVSRVYAEWNCGRCGSSWRSDAGTGRLIARLNTAEHLEGGVKA
jgi:ribosomal protein L37AE/L43A